MPLVDVSENKEADGFVWYGLQKSMQACYTEEAMVAVGLMGGEIFFISTAGSKQIKGPTHVVISFFS